MIGKRVDWWRTLRIGLILIVVMTASVVPGVSLAQELEDGDPCAVSDVPPSADEIIVPSQDYRTIQAGICDLQDGGVLYLQPGTYFERIVIWGKHVVIQGSGNEEQWPVLRADVPTEVVPASEALGVITVGGGGSLNLEKIRIIGGDSGVLIQYPSGPVEIKHAALERNGRGILHFSSGELSLKHTTFSNQSWNGISYVPFDPQAENCGGLLVSHGLFESVGGAGIYVRGCWHTIDHTYVTNALGGGIVVIASVSSIESVGIVDARYWGVLLVNTIGAVQHSLIAQTYAGPIVGSPNLRWGDAISVFSTDAPWAQGGPLPPSDIYVNHVTTYDSDRASLAVLGGRAALKNNYFQLDSYDINTETYDGYPAILTDLGGNQCDGGNCIRVSSSMEPPAIVEAYE